MFFSCPALIVMCFFLLFLSTQAVAQDNDVHLDGYIRTTFSEREGDFSHISGMAQTPDGWLWFAGRGGLYRFDGIKPELVDISAEDAQYPSTVFATKSGDLWLTWASGRIVVLPKGDFRHPSVIRANAPADFSSFMEDGNGGIWACGYNAIYKLHGGDFYPLEKEFAPQAQHCYAGHVDTEGTLWVLTDAGVFTLSSGSARFEHSGFHAAWLDQHLDGPDAGFALRVYGNAYLSIVVAFSGKKEAAAHSQSFFRGLTDSKGNIWVASPTIGIRRASSTDPAALTMLGQSLGSGVALDPSVWHVMSSAESSDLFEDSQHNVWAVTRTGLDRFRPTIATTLPLPRGDHAYAMLPERDGSIWFGTAQSVHPYRWWHVSSKISPTDGYDLDTTATYRDKDGSILLGTGGGLLRRFKEGKFQAISPLPPFGDQGDDVIAIARDGQDKLWVSIVRHPISRLDNGKWISKGGFNQLPDTGNRRAVTDKAGRLWLGYPHDLFIINDRHLERYSRDEGMDITSVGDIIPDGIPLVGGLNGIAAFDGQRFHHIFSLDDAALTNINGMVRLKDGALWLYGQKGAVRIGPGEIERAMKDSSYKVVLQIYDDDSGIPGAAQSSYPNPSLIEGADGRLWFAGDAGLAWLDPAKILHGNDPAAVIRSITSGNATYRSDVLPSLPPGTSGIQIDYTAIGQSDPASSRFRFKLNGIDKVWQNAGGRRQAFYSNLGPGTYRFIVETTRDDNTWSASAAHIDITLQPAFYQTGWFRILCVLFFLALLCIAYLYHLRRVTRRLRFRLEDRHAERDRIARELHDTYLQTVHGLVLKVSAVSEKMPEGGPRDEITRAISLAGAALVEGRNRVYGLREQANNKLDLASAFKDIGPVLNDEQRKPAFIVNSSGGMRFADPLVIDELYVSGREAIINAFNHAFATRIWVDIHLDRHGIRVQINDDGKGIDPQILQDGGIPGHWGLRGIQERLRLVGGECQILSSTSGTRVMLSVPAKRAYVHR